MHGMSSSDSSEEGNLMEERCESFGLGIFVVDGGGQGRGGAADTGPCMRNGGAPEEQVFRAVLT